ncbi:MAG: DUF4149 domain-containing protein [Acidobacteria bacterium]|nr:DUF4149 domain-containing protein [Acidobacteriota bacterium]
MIAQKIRLTLLSFWLGAMSLFSFIVAPAAFAVLPERQLAGIVVSRVLGSTEIIGVALGVILLLILLFRRERKGKAYLFELATLVLMTVSMIVSRFVVSKQLHDLRVKHGEQLATLAQSDPVRVTFDQLHQYSVWLMGFNIIAAIVLIVLLVRRTPSSQSND